MGERFRAALRPAVVVGLVGGVMALLLSLVGMVNAFAGRPIITGVLSMGHTLLFLTALVTGMIAARRVLHASRGAGRPVALPGAALAGLASGFPLAVLVLVGQVVNLRAVLQNANPVLYGLLTFGRDPGAGLPQLVLAGALVGSLGGALTLLPGRVSQAVVAGLGTMLLTGLFAELLQGILWDLGVPAATTRLFMVQKGLTVAGALVTGAAGALVQAVWASQTPKVRRRLDALPPERRRRVNVALAAVGLAIVLWLPQVLGSFLSYVLVLVGLYVLMGLGLNLEVGWAGLLDLGFVAFFAIGAYTLAILTSPETGWLALTFWQALPVAVLVALIAGVILGVPVLGIRGDYLAIATLGFGEIVRLLVGSDWLRPLTGGSQGIAHIPRPVLGNIALIGPQQIYYLVVAGCIIVWFVATRLRNSRLGRAWMAMREDEDVAQAMGINLVQTKLLAYGLGAGFAGVAGAIFAAMIGSVFPHSFQLIISINVLALIIVGGMGSIPGVFVGALFLVAMPELLREFTEYRLFMYGGLLIAMMLLRPQGLWPEPTVRLELAESEEPEVPARVTAATSPGQGD